MEENDIRTHLKIIVEDGAKVNEISNTHEIISNSDFLTPSVFQKIKLNNNLTLNNVLIKAEPLRELNDKSPLMRY